MPNYWLLRHGSSHSNEGGASADSWRIPLTSTGEMQAREAAREWSNIIGARPFRLVASPMLRAQQTAEHIRRRFPQVVLEVEHGIREFEPYDFSQLPAMMPAQRKPMLMEYWANCDPDRVGDGQRAESFAQFRRRVEAALTSLQGGTVDALVVCHGGVIKLAELLAETGSQPVEERALMRAWIDRATIHNCGLRQFTRHLDRPSP